MKADSIVFMACCAIGLLALGITIGQQHPAPACPIVAGQQVVSTIDSPGMQVCVYANAYGRSTRRVRL